MAMIFSLRFFLLLGVRACVLQCNQFSTGEAWCKIQLDLCCYWDEHFLSLWELFDMCFVCEEFLWMEQISTLMNLYIYGAAFRSDSSHQPRINAVRLYSEQLLLCVLLENSEKSHTALTHDCKNEHKRICPKEHKLWARKPSYKICSCCCHDHQFLWFISFDV